MRFADLAPGMIQVWGLTGGIASGKSSVARIFEEHGIPVLDADRLTRELSAPGGAAHDAIEARFGTADRARVREIVFKDPAARKDLEAILHPLIRSESERRIRALLATRMRETAAAGLPPSAAFPLRLVYEAALLVETGRYKDFAGLLVVETPREVRIRRIMERDSHPRELAERIIDAQIGDEERRAAATHVVKNDGDQDALRKKVETLIPMMFPDSDSDR